MIYAAPISERITAHNTSYKKHSESRRVPTAAKTEKTPEIQKEINLLTQDRSDNYNTSVGNHLCYCG